MYTELSNEKHTQIIRRKSAERNPRKLQIDGLYRL